MSIGATRARAFSASVATILIVAAGCGRNSAPTQPSAPGGMPAGSAAPGNGFKIALVMSGPTTDKGWNAIAYNAWMGVRKALKLRVFDSPFVENAKSSGDQEKSLRAYASQGFNVVVGHGNEYEAPALRMEKDFPKTLFVISSGGKVGANTMPIVFKLEDGAYLLGMLAAATTKTGKLACVGADQTSPLKSVFGAFAAGAKAQRPDVTILTPVYTGSWDDPGKAKQATLPLIDQGADVIMQDVDAAAPGVFNAVMERNKPDHPVYALGTNSDQNSAAPSVILASAPIDNDKVFLDIITAAKNGTLKPNDRPYGMPEGIIGYVPNPALASKIPAEIAAKIADMQSKITSRAFTVPQISK